MRKCRCNLPEPRFCRDVLSAYSADSVAKIIITRSAQDTIVARDHKRFSNNNGALFFEILGRSCYDWAASSIVWLNESQFVTFLSRQIFQLSDPRNSALEVKISQKNLRWLAFMVFETGKKNLWKPKTQNFQGFKKGYKFLFKQKIGSKSSHWKWQIFLQRSSSLKSEPSIVTIIEWVQFICPTAFQYGSHDFVAAVAPQSSE